MEVFIEQLVIRRKTAKDLMISTLMILSIFFILIVSFLLANIVNFYFLFVGMFLILFDIYACWYVITGRNQEFEYAVTNNNLTIDRVIAKRRRKKVISIDIKKIEEMCQIKKRDIGSKQVNKVIYAGTDELDKDQYQILVPTEKYGKVLILFSPNQKVLDGMRNYLKHAIIRENF